MIVLGFVFLIVSLVAALFGFGEITNLSMRPARMLFFTCLALFLATTLYGMSHLPI